MGIWVLFVRFFVDFSIFLFSDFRDFWAPLRKNLKKMVKFGILIDYFRIIDRQTGFWKYGPHISINQRNPAYANLVIEWEITEVGEDHRSWGGSQKLGRITEVGEGDRERGEGHGSGKNLWSDSKWGGVYTMSSQKLSLLVSWTPFLFLLSIRWILKSRDPCYTL